MLVCLSLDVCGLWFYTLEAAYEELCYEMSYYMLYMLQVAYNLGLGSLTWVVATEVLPIRSKIVALANCQIKFILFNLWIHVQVPRLDAHPGQPDLKPLLVHRHQNLQRPAGVPRPRCPLLPLRRRLPLWPRLHLHLPAGDSRQDSRGNCSVFRRPAAALRSGSSHPLHCFFACFVVVGSSIQLLVTPHPWNMNMWYCLRTILWQILISRFTALPLLLFCKSLVAGAKVHNAVTSMQSNSFWHFWQMKQPCLTAATILLRLIYSTHVINKLHGPLSDFSNKYIHNLKSLESVRFGKTVFYIMYIDQNPTSLDIIYKLCCVLIWLCWLCF